MAAGDRPTGASSTPYRQDFDPTDSEDESICSVSDDGGAERMERMLGAAQVSHPMPPPPLLAPRNPRVLAAASRTAGSSAGAPKSLPERNLPPLPSTSFHPPSSPILAHGDGVPQDPEPRAQASAPLVAPGPDRSSLFFIPDKFKGAIRIEPTSSRMVQDEREWRLAEDHLLSVSTNE